MVPTGPLALGRRLHGVGTLLLPVCLGVLAASLAAGTAADTADQATSRLAVQARSGNDPGPTPVPASARGPVPAALTAGGASFSIGTFNVLGSQHTAGRLPLGPGKERAATAAKLILRKGFDVIGLQEVQPDQLRVLRRNLPDHDIWPGKTLGAGGVRLQIAYDRRVFSVVSSGSIDTPFDRQVRPMPWVELQNLASGRSIYVVNTHNSPRGMEQERDVATDQQVALIEQLRATRKAVFFLGDMNETREIFCKVAGRAGFDAANGGSATSRRDCTPPSGRIHIDWIFGAGPVSFTAYQWYAGRQVRATSDHHLIRAQVSVRPRSG
ncbi:MAG: endonuclease/exonuclease/phosphatase family protein [Nocardioides sp.]|nr:endonuclease/exonuclease/phosphatase family protein [Nocardioides sp.]